MGSSGVVAREVIQSPWPERVPRRLKVSVIPLIVKFLLAENGAWWVFGGIRSSRKQATMVRGAVVVYLFPLTEV